jgi:hypothetical protein
MGGQGQKRNISVFEYEADGGRLRYIVTKSAPRHAEKKAWEALEVVGVKPEQVKRVYSEYEPCTYAGCSKFLGKFTEATFSHSFEYGATRASRQAGVRALGRALKAVFG